ncbi:hypothetical protein ATO12_03585 [Aquimarina atlantica]|uniref:Uncharacterized protein n=1 Tax=Aquimarina atlantica TaxID=1317122 RepID=A0A023C0T7_9FLAO|nr:hypothetical protein [Aquimarina atlantica]EZH75885.1 hypothetical protein ATO12_03585 [Aquimarina atlantica]
MEIWNIVIIGILIYMIYTKTQFIKLRSNALKIEAEIVKYIREKGPMRNDYTLLNYPYVKIHLENEDYVIRKLRYADSSSKPFKIGEIIYVFWNNNDLLYWNTYDRGWKKYLPEKWNFLN